MLVLNEFEVSRNPHDNRCQYALCINGGLDLQQYVMLPCCHSAVELARDAK